MSSPGSDERKRCAREGCRRLVPRRDRSRGFCSYICSKVTQELERAHRICQATGDSEHWTLAVALNDAVTAYYRSDRRLFEAASEVGITGQQWQAIKDGTG